MADREKDRRSGVKVPFSPAPAAAAAAAAASFNAPLLGKEMPRLLVVGGGAIIACGRPSIVAAAAAAVRWMASALLLCLSCCVCVARGGVWCVVRGFVVCARARPDLMRAAGVLARRLYVDARLGDACGSIKRSSAHWRRVVCGFRNEWVMCLRGGALLLDFIVLFVGWMYVCSRSVFRKRRISAVPSCFHTETVCSYEDEDLPGLPHRLVVRVPFADECWTQFDIYKPLFIEVLSCHGDNSNRGGQAASMCVRAPTTRGLMWDGASNYFRGHCRLPYCESVSLLSLTNREARRRRAADSRRRRRRGRPGVAGYGVDVDECQAHLHG